MSTTKKRAKPKRKYLTKSVVDAATPPKKGNRDLLIWDADRGKSKSVSGFGVQVKPSGHKSFVLQYRNTQGRVRRLTLGRYGDISVQQARGLAEDAKHKVRSGRDPLEEKSEARRESEQPQTLGELCDHYLIEHAKRQKRSWREDERRIDNYIKPNLGRVETAAVTRQQVSELFLEISASHPWEANRVIVLLATIYNFAGREKTCLPPGFKNPAKRTRKERNSEPPRVRVLKSDERPRLLEAIEAEPNVYHRGLFKLLLLTGLRKSELLNAKYSDLDLKEKTLHLPKTKSGEPRLVPLSNTAIAMVRSLPRRVGCDYLFPAPKSNGPMSDPKVQWQRVRSKAGCMDLRVHDLRRTASHAIMKRVKNLKSAQLALGHADIQTTLRHYALAEEAEAREGVEALAETFLTGA